MKSTENGARAFAFEVAVAAMANAPGPVTQKEREGVRDVVSIAPGRRRWAVSVLLAVLGFVQPSFAQSAIDGDTLSFNGQTIRLYGIDAPELKQTCGNRPAGELAHEALASMVIGRQVSCEGKGHDRYGRTLAVCKVDGFDIGAEMVRTGMAWAFTRYSVDYLSQEIEAKTAGRGVHWHDCEAAPRKRS